MDEDWGHEQIQWRGINCYRPSQVRDQILQAVSGKRSDVQVVFSNISYKVKAIRLRIINFGAMMS